MRSLAFAAPKRNFAKRLSANQIALLDQLRQIPAVFRRRYFKFDRRFSKIRKYKLHALAPCQEPILAFLNSN